MVGKVQKVIFEGRKKGLVVAQCQHGSFLPCGKRHKHLTDAVLQHIKMFWFLFPIESTDRGVRLKSIMIIPCKIYVKN
jgi:hypothetical protein